MNTLSNIIDDQNAALVEDVIEVDNSYWSDQKEALERLKNKQFYKKLIEEGYFKNYMADLVMQLIRKDVIEQGRRNVILEKLVGIAKLQDYFHMIGALSTTEDMYHKELEKMEVDEINRIIAVNEAMDEAENDPDFKKLVTEHYLKDYAVTQTSLITNDVVVSNGDRAEVLETLAGISTLANYFVGLRRDLAAYNTLEEEEIEDEVKEVTGEV